jgi:hypothetical protein
MTRVSLPGAFYSGALPDGGYFAEYADRIDIGGGKIQRPAGGLGALVGTRIKGQLYLAGQGHDDGQAWLWSVSGWRAIGPTHGVRPCAFGRDALFVAIRPDAYMRVQLDNGATTTHPLAIGSQGLRYVDGNTPVPGDATIFDGTVHEFIDRGDVRVGQGHHGIVKFLEGRAVLHYLTRAEVESLPKPGVILPVDPTPEPEEPEPVAFESPNLQSLVEQQIALHPEINTRDEAQRGRILDYVCAEANAHHAREPFGRKGYDAAGKKKNTDGLTYMRRDGLFEIYDVIGGRSGKATWVGYGPFRQGENGYWVKADSVAGPIQPPTDYPPLSPGEIFGAYIRGLEARIKALESRAEKPSQPFSLNGKQIALRTAHGTYVKAEDVGHVINASATGAGAWETFTIEEQ